MSTTNFLISSSIHWSQKSVHNINIRKEKYYNENLKILAPPHPHPPTKFAKKTFIPNFKFKALKSKLKPNTKASDLVYANVTANKSIMNCTDQTNKTDFKVNENRYNNKIRCFSVWLEFRLSGFKFKVRNASFFCKFGWGVPRF